MVKMKIDNNVSEAPTLPDTKSVEIRKPYPSDAKSVEIREPYPSDAKSVEIREPYPYVEPELSAVDEAGIYEDSTFASVDIYADGLNAVDGLTPPDVNIEIENFSIYINNSEPVYMVPPAEIQEPAAPDLFEVSN